MLPVGFAGGLRANKVVARGTAQQWLLWRGCGCNYRVLTTNFIA